MSSVSTLNSPSCDVLLVTSPRPPWVSPKSFEFSENSCPPLGVLYIAASLERAGVNVIVEDLYKTGAYPSEIATLIKKNRPRILGISTNTGGVYYAHLLCRHAKISDPSVKTVMGGIHPTVLPRDVLSDANVDYVVLGEGEKTFLELALTLLEGNRAQNIKMNLEGIGYKNKKRVFLNPERQLLPIDDIAWPARHLVRIDSYLQKGALIAGRGCSHRCYFCSSVSLKGHLNRFRDPFDIVEEMDSLQDSYKINEFEFLDDNLTSNHAKLTQLCALLKPRKWRWSCQGAVRDFMSDASLLKKMLDSGCAGLFFGFESGNEELMRKIKGIDKLRAIRLVKHARNLGINVIVSFIIGHPWDTVDTIQDTFNLMLKLRGMGCHTPISIAVPFPGSDLERRASKYGVRIRSRDYRLYYHSRALLNTPHLSWGDLEGLYFDILDSITAEDESAGSSDLLKEET